MTDSGSKGSGTCEGGRGISAEDTTADMQKMKIANRTTKKTHRMARGPYDTLAPAFLAQFIAAFVRGCSAHPFSSCS
jgi:hypothetical protein